MIEGVVLTDRPPDISAAVVMFLEHCPGENEEESRARFGTGAVREAVRAILDDISRIQIGSTDTSLAGIGEEVE